jgi:exodeoxyribonuclease V alpha subunit
MTNVVEKDLCIEAVSPGKIGGFVAKGRPVGEFAEVRFKVSSHTVMRLPEKGEFWRFVGRMSTFTKNDGTVVPQMLVQSCHPVNIPSASYVTTLLANHQIFRGFAFGRKKVYDLVEAFKNEGEEEELVRVLDAGEIHRLSRVLGYPMARNLVDAWQRLRSENETICFLIDHNFTAGLARKVMYLCQNSAVERLKANPYSLICFGGLTRNIWRTVENCAKKLGLSLDFGGRLVGAIEHVLYQHLRDGHTVMAKSDLLSRAERLLRTRKRAEEGLRMALERKAICVYPRQPEQLFQLIGVGIIEQTLERRIDQLVSGPKQMPLFGDDARCVKVFIEDYSAKVIGAGGYALNNDQKDAVLMALTNRCSVITGYGGTGKTTVLKAVAEIAKFQGRRAYMLALAGKAKERLREATGHKSFTIHAFIGAVKKSVDDIDLDNNPLIVIDECSMVDTALFNNLLSLFEGKQYSLLTVGDTAQISPVGFGLVWHRMAMMDTIPRVNLTQVYRQQSVLHDVAMKVRGNDEKVLIGLADDIPDWNGELEGVFFADADAGDLHDRLVKLKTEVDGKLRERVKDEFRKRLNGVALEAQMLGEEDAGEIPKAVILTPHMSRKRADSGDRINVHLQGCLTPLASALKLGERWLREGDPVIVTENNYDLGLFNGTTGTLLRTGARNGTTTGLFRLDGHEKSMWLTMAELFDVGMRPAYAVSIHKSQGSEYDAVLVTCIENSPMLEKSLVYTALTRAKGLCLIVGSREVFRNAVTSPSRAETLEVGFFLSRMDRLAA